MIKLLFYARDPGGANCIVPVIFALASSHKYQVLVYAKDFAFHRIKDQGINVYNIDEYCDSGSSESIKHLLETIAPSMVITGTSVNDYSERFLWKAAKSLGGIKTLAIVDQWMNLGIRFSKYNYSEEKEYWKNPSHEYVPDKICVIDDLCKKNITKEGIAEKNVVVTGQPHFDVIYRDYLKVLPADLDKDMINIIFASEPIYQDYDDYGKKDYWGFNQFSIFENLVEVLEEIAEPKRKMNLIIRPHPREDISEWEKRIKDVKGVSCNIDKTNSTYSLLKSCRVVCGMSSMMLLESVICKKAIISIMIGLRQNNPFVLDTIGVSKSILDKESLRLAIKKMLVNNFDTSELEFYYEKNATENVVDTIEKELNHGKISN